MTQLRLFKIKKKMPPANIKKAHLCFCFKRKSKYSENYYFELFFKVENINYKIRYFAPCDLRSFKTRSLLESILGLSESKKCTLDNIQEKVKGQECLVEIRDEFNPKASRSYLRIKQIFPLCQN